MGDDNSFHPLPFGKGKEGKGLGRSTTKPSPHPSPKGKGNYTSRRALSADRMSALPAFHSITTYCGAFVRLSTSCD